MDEIEEDQFRRLAARKANEALRLTATLLNNLAVGIIVAGLIAPSVSRRSPPIVWYGALTTLAFALHFLARHLLHGLKSEE